MKEIKNDFNGRMRRLDADRERITDLEDMSVEISQTAMQREKQNEKKKMKQYPRTVGQLEKG